MELEFFVLHSAYPDGSWRGIEKCLVAPNGGPLLFHTAEDAASFVRDSGLKTNYYTVVPVSIMVPSVGAKPCSTLCS